MNEKWSTFIKQVLSFLLLVVYWGNDMFIVGYLLHPVDVFAVKRFQVASTKTGTQRIFAGSRPFKMRGKS
jgi:hypothetical protein